jgi:hypothetical protein
MKRLLAVILLVTFGCGGGTALASLATPATSPSPLATVALSKDPFPAACQTAKSGIKHVTSEVVAMLEAYVAEREEPPDTTHSMAGHMTAAYNWSTWTIRELPGGAKADPRLKKVADALRRVRGLLTGLSWTPTQISDASKELITAGTELGECT